MVDERHKEVQKAFTSKGAKTPIGDANRDESENESSSDSEGLNYEGFMKEEIKALRSMINRQVGKAIENVMPFYISQTTDNLKEGRMMNDSRNEMETSRDFTACDAPKFDGTLDPIACTKWLSAVEGAFRTSCCKEKKKVDFASNFLRDSAKMCETLNEMWKKFNDLIRYYPVYHGNEKLKVKKFQRMLRDDIREVISLFKCATLEDLLSRSRLREADLLRKKNKETKRKLDFVDQDAKKPKQDQVQRSGGTKIKTPCKKCHKTHLGACQANLPGCYKCGALNHISKDCKKPMILCYNCNQLGHKSNECPNLKAIEAKPLKSIKEEKVEKTGIRTPTARVYMMAIEGDKVARDVVTSTILVNSIPARVLYDSSVSISFVSFEFSKNLSTPPNKLLFPLEVEIAGDEIVVVSKVYRDVEIEIDDSVFKIDLIPIVLGAFDVTIGMDWLDRFIRPSSSPWGTPILFVKKKDASMHMCKMYILYQGLMISSINSKARDGSKIDLRSSYHQLKVRFRVGSEIATPRVRNKKKLSSPYKGAMKSDSNRRAQGSGDDYEVTGRSHNKDHHFHHNLIDNELYKPRSSDKPWNRAKLNGSRELASTNVVLATTEKIEIIHERLKEAQDRWKSYANKKRRPIEFNVRDFVMLKVSPWKGVMRFKNKGKLSLRFLRPFKILKRVGEVAYVLELPKEMKVEWKHRKGTSIRWEPDEKMRIRLGDSKPFDTLADLGSCVNLFPLYLFKKLKIGLLEATDHVFGLADGTKSYPVGIVKTIEVHIGKLKLLEDFYVIDMEKDLATPFLVGRGFLATANAEMGCRKAKIAVREGVARSIFRLKEIDLGDEEVPYWTTIGKQESYTPRPSTE
nr:hypothetical protein [Tanacetum cinerariifolium]